MSPIVKNLSIREKYSQGFTRSAPPTEIIIHGTGGGSSPAGIIKWMEGGERASQYRRGIAIFHYLVGRDGSITEIIDPGKWVYHSSSGRHDERTVGIENINPDPGNHGEYTTPQYVSLLELIDYLMGMYPIRTIAGHGETAVRYSGPQAKKNCPGEGFDWQTLADHLVGNGLQFTAAPERISGIMRA